MKILWMVIVFVKDEKVDFKIDSGVDVIVVLYGVFNFYL